MSWVEIVADHKIRDAFEEGAFENLPGRGKPLDLEADRRLSPEQRAAYRLMHEASVLPDWIQLDKDIRSRQELFERRVEQYARGRLRDLEALNGRTAGRGEETVDLLRERFLTQAAQGLKEINRLIDRLALIAPTPAQQRARIDIEPRLVALDERFPRFNPYATGEVSGWRALLDQKPEGMPELGNRMPMRRR